jgi:hypothetical protein
MVTKGTATPSCRGAAGGCRGESTVAFWMRLLAGGGGTPLSLTRVCTSEGRVAPPAGASPQAKGATIIMCV